MSDITKTHAGFANNAPTRIYKNKIEKKTTFKTKKGYYL